MIDNLKVQQDLINAFGFEAGMRICAVALPNILKDFETILKNSPSIAIVSESYQFDDMPGSIVLYGQGGTITQLKINVN